MIKRLPSFSCLAILILGAALILGCDQTFSVSSNQANQLNLQLMEREQLAEDTLPAFLQSSVRPETSRLIDSRNSRTYWAAFNEDDEICLILGVNIDRPDFTAGLSCVDVEFFVQFGMHVVVQSGQIYSAAIFVPDGYTQALLDAFPGNYVAANFVAIDSATAASAAFPNDEPMILAGEETAARKLHIEPIR